LLFARQRHARRTRYTQEVQTLRGGLLSGCNESLGAFDALQGLGNSGAGLLGVAGMQDEQP